LLKFVILFSRDARAEPHVEIRRRDNGLKAAHQFAQRGALGLKLLATGASGYVRRSPGTWPVPQFKFINFSPRVAAFLIGHDYTT
jgi:hypothetical protein